MFLRNLSLPLCDQCDVRFIFQNIFYQWQQLFINLLLYGINLSEVRSEVFSHSFPLLPYNIKPTKNDTSNLGEIYTILDHYDNLIGYGFLRSCSWQILVNINNTHLPLRCPLFTETTTLDILINILTILLDKNYPLWTDLLAWPWKKWIIRPFLVNKNKIHLVF